MLWVEKSRTNARDGLLHNHLYSQFSTSPLDPHQPQLESESHAMSDEWLAGGCHDARQNLIDPPPPLLMQTQPI